MSYGLGTQWFLIFPFACVCGMYVCAEAREDISISLSCLHLIPLRQGLSQSLELGRFFLICCSFLGEVEGGRLGWLVRKALAILFLPVPSPASQEHKAMPSYLLEC